MLKSWGKICEIVTKNCYKNIFLLEKFVQLSFVVLRKLYVAEKGMKKNCKTKPLSMV